MGHGHRQRTLDSDSDDDPVGLPGDRDDDEDCRPHPTAAASQWPSIPDLSPPASSKAAAGAAGLDPPPQAVGFEIVGFGTGAEAAAGGAARQGPSDGLLERLHSKTRRRRPRRGDASDGGAEADSERPERTAPARKRSRNRQRHGGARHGGEDGRGAADAAQGTPDAAGAGDAAAAAPVPAGGIGVGVGIEDQQSQRELEPPGELSEADRVDCRNHVALFGEELVRALRSARWQHRLEGLRELQGALHSYPTGRHKAKVLELVVTVLVWTVVDSVFHVFQQAVAFWRYLLDEYLDDVDGREVRAKLRPGMRVLVGRLGDINGRVRDQAHELLLAAARHPNVGVDFVAGYATSGVAGGVDESVTSICSVGDEDQLPGDAAGSASFRKLGGPSGNAGWKVAIGKINLALALVQEHGLPAVGPLGVPSVMGLAAEALNISNAKVRKTAAALVVEVYRRCGKSCEAYLRDVSASALKMLKQEIEVEICDVQALETADAKGQEEEDLANLEPELSIAEDQRERLLRWQALLGTRSFVCLFSKKWKLRDNVVARLRERIQLALEGIREQRPAAEFGGSDTPLYDPSNYQLTRAVCEALIQIAELGLLDSIPQLVVSCCTLLRPVVELYARFISACDLRDLVSDSVLQHTIAQVSGAASVVSQACSELMLWLARQPKVGVGFVANFITQPDPRDKRARHWKGMLGRLNFLLVFIPEFEFGQEGMPIERVMTYTVSCFQCPNGKVRSAAVGVIIEAYKQCGNAIRVYLRHQKPALLNELKEKIAKVARKERTKTAPVHTLASIVQPLGVEDELDRVLPSGRPATFPTVTEADAMRPEGPSIRERVAQWKREQEDGAGAAAAAGNGGRRESCPAQPGGYVPVTTLQSSPSWPSSRPALQRPGGPGAAGARPPLPPGGAHAPATAVVSGAPGSRNGKLVFS
eukprot:TRINITY_DN20655_c0_g1_i1.p1 TRINITY_DN20655_c0_g1~~TRINITY_DN20655_c0_g1_i1.p1  ORF type:complete len:962 (+),score=202.93 TRINITY_DN20655_c0_g1_i1:96-2888(+)